MEPIKDFLDNYIVQYWNRFTRRVDKLIQFTKLGWNDYDWDQDYLTTVLDSKIDSMGRYFTQHGIDCSSKEHNIKVLRVLKKALDRWQADDYTDKYLAKKMGYPVRLELEQMSSVELKQRELSEDSNACIINKYHGWTGVMLTPDEVKEYNKQNMRAWKFEHRMKRKYKRIFFNTLYKNYESLWD